MVTSDTPEMNGARSPNQGQQKSPRKIKSDDNASFLRAARAGNLEKVLEYLKTDTDINICNPNGLNALHLASKEGHVHVVNELLSRGAKIDSATKKGNTALHIASLAGQEEVVKILIEHGSSVNVQSQNGFTPLYMAAQENHDGVVRFLLQSGANQSLATEDGFTPLAVALQQGHDRVVAVLLENDTRGKVRLPALHIAAKKDDTKAAGLLLQNDHNPDVTSKSGFTPLHIASHYGNESIAALLLTRNANVNYAAKHSITPLHVAAKWGKANMVQLLLDKGANLESKTRDGLTPLHCAARSGHENVVDVMIQRSAPISAKTKNGLAPLHMASQGDHVDAARILLHHKAPVDEVTVDYLTALHVAAHCGHVRVAKLLLDRKADPNARALNGFTPLHIACKKNRIKVVELLLKYGASIEATTESGLTPLHVASFMGCMNIVIYLIQHQASPDEATVRGETPLHLAARANQTDIIRILLRNGAKVDARAREQQTPLHIASRLGNVDIVVLLLQSGAQVDATTKDLYTALHIAAKEGQEEVAGVLIDHNASLTATTKKGFTPLHLAAKYGNIKVSRLLLQREAPVDAEGKNGVTPLHVAAHYDHQNVALLLLNEGASPHAAAKNGYTPLHITAKKNQLDIAKSLLEYGAKTDAESKAGFTPLHLAAQEGHVDMTNLLMKNGADVNAKAKNGLAPMHLCAQEDRVNVAAILASNGAEQDAETKAGYTPLHVASHFGSVGMVRFLLEQGVRVDVQNELGYTPLHQAAQQGHSQIVDLLLENNASPNTVSNNGQTALSIAQKLGYISVVETLKVVTEQEVTTTTTTTVEEKYRVMAPESMHETFLSDSEDEGGEENMLGDHSYKYLTADEMKSLGDDSMPIDVTHDEKQQHRDTLPHPQQIKTNGSMIVNGNSTATSGSIEAKLLQMEQSKDYSYNEKMYAADNVDLPVKTGVNIGFLVSFMVDARGGAMRGCRHSGVRVIIPPRKAPMPMRITCRYLKKDKLIHPPPLMEGEAIASRILELGPAGAKFLGPVIIEVPHFASLRGKEREIVILRSDNGETWKEHTLEATEDAVQDVLQESFDADEMNQLEDLNTNRITRILTTDFPQYFAIVSRIRQEVHAIGPDGGVVNSTVVPQVQAVFPHGALTKKIKVGLQAQPIPPELTAKLLGNRVAVSPIVTVEPRRRKFHKAITLTIPLPQASGKGMLNDYSSGSPPNSLRLLCSITGGTTRAQWEDVTGSTPLTFVKDCVNFTTTVSARFWLMDCRNIGEATKFATELYREAIHVPFMAKFVVFAKRHDVNEARLRVFCMTDDKEEKTLENQEHFTEVAKSRDVEVLEGTSNFIEFGGNLVPVTKSGEQLSLRFWAFRENRLPFTVKVKDPHSEAMGRIAFMKEPKLSKQDAPQTPICNLNVDLPSDITPEPEYPEAGEEYMALQKKHQFLRQAGYGKFDTIHRADLRISDIGNLLGSDWVHVAKELEIDDSDINIIKAEYPNNEGQQGMVMLRLWLNTHGNRATGNELEKALRACNRDDIVDKCMFNVEMVTDAFEKQVAKNQIQEDVPAARLLAAPLKRVDAISEDEDEVHETITTTTYEEKQGHDQIITEKQQSVVESENGETITTTTTTTTKRVISSEEEYEKSQFDSSYERDEAKYVAEEKDPDSHRESSESEEEEHEEEEEHIEVIEETQTEVAEVPKRTSTPPPSPLTKHEPMEEFQRGTEPSLEEAVQIAAKDISDEAEVAIPVVEERREYHEEEKSSSTRSSESQDEVDERMAENEAEVQESGFDTQQLGHAPPSTLPERRSSTSSSSSKSSSNKGDQEHDVELDRDDSLDDEMIVHEDEAPLGDPAQTFHEQERQEPERLSVSIQEEDEDEGEGDDYYEGEIESKRQPMASSTPAKSMTHGSSSASVSHSNSPSPDNNPPARPPNSISSIPSHLFVDNHMVSNMSADSMFVNVASESEFVADDTVEDTAEEFDQGDDDSLQFMVVEEKSEPHLHAEHREEVSEPVSVVEEKQTCDQFAVDGADLREEVDEPMCVEKRVELLYDDEDVENNKEDEKEEEQKSLENEQEVESEDEPDHETLSSPSPIRESDDVERDDYYEGEVETKKDSPKSRSRSSSSTSSSPPLSSSRKSSKSSISAKGTSETHEEVDDHQTTTTITKTTITTTTTTNDDNDEDDDSDDEVDQNSDGKDSIIPRSDSDFRPEQAQTQRSITPDLPLPETLCGTNIPTSNSADQEEETTFGDKKKFWEQMSSTESMASSSSDHNLEAKASGVASAQSPMTDIPEENVASVEITTVHSKKINVDELSFSAIKSEWTKEELAEQLTPERKEHFETFVKPALEEDSNESSMEDKKMPLHSERSSIDKDKFVTMQIKGDILESELDQQEESVMSEHFIEQNNTTIVSDTVTRQTVSYEATEDQRTRIVTNVTITETDLSGQLTETRERSERSVPEMDEPMPMTHVIESHEIVEKTSANGSSKLRVHISSDSLLVDDDQLRQNRISTPHPVKKSIIITAPSEEDEEQDENQDQSQDDDDDSALEDPPMDLETARDIASEVVANVGQEALKKVEEIRRSQEELDFEKSMPKPTVEVTFDEYFVVEDIPDEYDQIEVEEVQSVPDVDHQSQAHNMEEVRKVAQEFVEGIEEQAKEMAEKISPMGTNGETIRQQIETEKWREEEITSKSPVQIQASKAMHSEISLDISDSDLQADLTEVQDELKRHYSEVEVESDEISASELHKSEGLELRREIAEGFEDVQDRLNDVVDQVVMGEVSYHHYVPSHFPTITSFRSHFVRPFDGEDFEGISHQNLSSVPIIASNPAEHQQEPPSESQVFGSVQSHSVQDQSSTFISSTNSEDIWASEAKVMLRKDRIDHTKKSSEHDSSSSNSKLHRRSGTDFESGGGWSSSGDNYVTATASASALSRPSSSDMEAMYSAMSSAKSSTLTADYETAHGSSTHSALSTDYFTAVSSMTSKDSLRSLDTSESSGCLGSVEVSETTEPSEMLMDNSIHSERDLITPTGAPLEEFASHSPIVSTMTPLVEDTSETDDEARSPVILPNMKRSVEMVFNDVSEGANKAMHELSESRETLNASILTISSGSEVTVQEIKESSNPATTEESFLAQGATPEESRCGSRESYQFPRVVSFETSVFDGHGHSELRGQKSFDSEFGSRPESELKILESRPQSMSEAMFSRSSSEDQRPSSKEDMSDSELPIMLKVKSDPFDRPVTPEPCYEEEEEIIEGEEEEQEHLGITQAVEQDTESEVEHNVEFIPGVEIMHAYAKDDDLLVESPPIKSKPVSVSYWPPPASDEDHEVTKGLLDNEEVYYTEDVEEEKEWLARQFDGENKVTIEDEGFYYSPPLDQIVEEEEDHEKDMERLKTCLKESKEFDTSRFKRLDQMKATDRDDVSMSSLQEFEKLESQVSTCGGSRSSFGSQDSLEAGPIKVMKKNSKGDDISVDSYASLQEFEKLEQACHDVVVIEKMAKEQEDVLSEIEEGHESLYSESTDSAETLSEACPSEDDNSDDFEERMFQIDEIIKQAQSNVEQFSTSTSQQPFRQTEMLPLEDILGRNDSNTDSTGADKTPSVGTPESDSLEASPPKEGYHCASYRKSVLSVSSAARDQDQMQTSVDSLDMNRHTNVMETSIDSLDGRPVAKGPENIMALSTDSIEQDSNNMCAMTKSTDSLEGNGTVKPGIMMKSTDSLEESMATCSNNTRATASMLSSGASDTLVDDLEYDPAKAHPGMKKMLLASGEIHISDSDDNSISSKDTVDISHSQVSFGHHVREVIRTSGGDEEYSQVIERTIELPADVSRVSFRGPHAEEKMREYMSQFGADDDVQETEYVDEKGNVVKKKVVQHRIVANNSKPRSQGDQFQEGEKFDSSCEEFYEEVDEEGNKKQYVIKRSVEPVVQATKTIEVIAERRLQQGVKNPMELNIFKSGESTFQGSGSQGYWSEDVKGSPRGSASDVDDVIQRKMSTGHNEGESHA